MAGRTVSTPATIRRSAQNSNSYGVYGIMSTDRSARCPRGVRTLGAPNVNRR
jgi:hypothetical protein